MTKTGSKYRCSIWGNEVVIVRNTGGNLLYCG
jgi:Desulfoferrodoxin, N-terminal domain